MTMTTETTARTQTYRGSAPWYHSLIRRLGLIICGLAGLVFLAACQTTQPQRDDAGPAVSEAPEKEPTKDLAKAAEKEPEKSDADVESAATVKVADTSHRAESQAKVDAMVPIKIPVDGSYTGTTVNGTSVRSVHILDGGRKVRVSETMLGRPGGRVVVEFKNSDDAPSGYFTSARIDTNSDGELAGEFEKKGVWKMDEKGNIVQIR